MKLSGTAAEGFCRKPDRRAVGILLHGPDAGHTAEMRRILTRQLDPDRSALTRLDAGEVRRSPAVLHDALRAGGFFAAEPLVLVTGAADGLNEAAGLALDGLEPGKALLVLEAGTLTGRSTLKRRFENGRALLSLGLYPDPPDGPEIERALAEAGLAHGLDAEALALLVAQARETDRGGFARLIETVALFGADATGPLGAAEIAPLMPMGEAGESEALMQAVMLGRAEDAVVLSRRLAAAGTTPVSLAIAAGGMLQRLMTAACHPKGPNEGLGALRPPVFGPRRDTMAAILRRWSPADLGRALGEVQAMDARLRSAGRRPDAAMMERLLIRLTLTAPR